MTVLTRPFMDDIKTFSWGIVGLFSAWGGIVRYLIDHPSGKFACKEMFCQVAISGFTGLLGGFYAYEHNYSSVMILATSGVSGSFGGNLLKWVWQRIFHK
ncbi:holin [Salmonella enterica subsp. enterica]|nr:holin [Salmonella enterica subsp. enterica]EDT7315837.1 holin [Salmonella enterica subsp. enterica]